MKIAFKFLLITLMIYPFKKGIAQIDQKVETIISKKDVNDTVKAYELMDYADQLIINNSKKGIAINNLAYETLKNSKLIIPAKFYVINKWIDVKGYYFLGNQYIQENNLDSAKNYLLLSIKINEEVNDSKYFGLALHSLGYLEQLNKNYEYALKGYKLSLSYAEDVNDLDELSWLHRNIGFVDIHLKDYIEAEKYFKLALEDYIKLKNDHYVKISYYNLALLYNLTGRFEEGIETYKNVLKYTNDKKELGEVYSSIASFYYNLLNYDRAIEYCKKSLIIFSEINDKVSEANNLNLISEIYLSKKEYDRSFESTKLSLKISLETKDSLAIATSLSDLGNFYEELRDYDQSIKYYTEALRIYASRSDYYSASLIENNISLHYFNRGEYNFALEHCDKSIFCLEKLSDERAWIETLNMKGNILSSRGQISEALFIYNKALSIATKFNELKSMANIYNNIGLLFQGFGDTENSLINLFKSIEISKKLKDQRFLNSTYMNYGNTLKDVGKFSDAWKYYMMAWEMSIKSNDENALSTIGQSISNYLNQMGKYEESLPYAQSSFKYDLHLKNRIKQAFDNRLLGVIYRQTGNYSKAIEMFKTSITINLEENVADEQIRDYVNLMKTYFLAGNYSETYKQIVHVNGLIQNNILVNIDFLPEKRKEFFIEQFNDFNSFVPNLLPHLNLEQKEKLLSDIVNLRLSFKGFLLNNFTNLKKINLEGSSSEVKYQYELWYSLKQKLVNIEQIDSKDAKSIEKRNKLILDTKRKSDSLEFILLNKISNKALKGNQNIKTNWEEIQNKLKTNEVAIEIFKYNKYGHKSRIWIIKDSLKLVPGYTDSVEYLALIIPPKGNKLELCVFYNGNFLDDDAYINYCSATHKPSYRIDTSSFYNYWNKINSLTDNYSRIYISADGIYNKLNIGAIFNPLLKKYILEYKDIIMLSSLKEILKEPIRKKTNQLNASLFGDPQFEIKNDQIASLNNFNLIKFDTSIARIGTHPLPATKIEINQIEETLKSNGFKTHVYLGLDANEANVKTMKDPTILHFATHGFFLKDNESKTISYEKSGLNEPLMKSGLLFAGAKNTLDGKSIFNQENGIFYSYEASELNLENTDLVVLSACETANGEIKNGEGVYGLQRAFKMAGAKQILMSMWSIPDNATKELMSEFYKQYVLNNDAQLSLKMAQLKLMEKYPNKPFYWGAFVVFGN